jgi:hypothetical protein
MQELFLGKPRNPLAGTDYPSLQMKSQASTTTNTSNSEPIDYAAMEALMARLSAQKTAKRAKAHMFRMEAKRLTRETKSHLANHHAAIAANVGRARKLEAEANASEIQYLTLDSQIELLGDVRLTGDTLKLFIQSTALVESELRKFSEADVSRIMEELEDTAEKAQEQIEETAVEPPGQAPMHWKEAREFMAFVNAPETAEREADEAEEEAKNAAFNATMNRLPSPVVAPSPPLLRIRDQHQEPAGHRKAITVAEFEGEELESIFL